MFYLFLRHKSASMWLQSILTEICRIAGWKHDVFWYSTLCGNSLPAFVDRHPDLDLLFVHDARPDQVMALGPVTGVHVTRDPRDVIVSGYRSHKGSHWFPEGTEAWHHQQLLRCLDAHNGLLQEIEYSRRFVNPIAGWLDTVHQPNIVEMSFDDVTRSPYDAVLAIMKASDRLSEDRSGTHFVTSILQGAFNRIAWKVGLRWPMPVVPGGLVLDAAYRRRYKKNAHHHGGKKDQWKDMFSAEHIALYQKLYGDLAERLGYEPMPTSSPIASLDGAAPSLDEPSES